MKHNFAFSGLITCGHCGCALVAERKKGKYVYYHCTGYKGKCPERYVRQELLEGKFTELLRSLVFDSGSIEWATEALRASHEDSDRFRQDSIRRLRGDYDRLEKRLETAYEDKLDGRIDGSLFDRKAAAWRDGQARILQAIEEHRELKSACLVDGAKRLDVTRRAADSFEKQSPGEKRRLSNFELSNCSWKNGDLTPKLRQPFDMIADGARVCASKTPAGLSASGNSEERYTRRDSSQVRILREKPRFRNLAVQNPVQLVHEMARSTPNYSRSSSVGPTCRNRLRWPYWRWSTQQVGNERRTPRISDGRVE